MIHYYKIELEYKGTRFLGWQVQPESSGQTVQGELNKALKIISKSESIRSMGAGRTDAGVHALGQVAKIEMPLEIPPVSLVNALNGNLPEDIRVLRAEYAAQDFHPTIHAKSKEYHYRFSNNRSSSAIQNELITNVSFDLDLDKMRAACQILTGKHDFTNFYCEGTEVSSYIREIFECEINQVESKNWMLPSHFIFRIVGDGFLKQMARLLMGAIWNVGRGKISLQDFEKALSSTRVQRLGPVAPPNGLYMFRVNY